MFKRINLRQRRRSQNTSFDSHMHMIYAGYAS